MKKNTFTFICTVCFASLLMAQNPVRWNVGIGVSFPIGDFGSMSYDKNTLDVDCALFDIDKKNGGAGTGLNIGGEMLYTLQSNLNLSVSADVNYSPLNSDAKSYTIAMSNYFAKIFKQQIITNGGTSVTSSCSLNKNSSYFNIPLMVGLRYQKPIGDKMRLYAFGSAGMNIRCITPLKYTIRTNYMQGGNNNVLNCEESFTYSTESTFAFRVGAGFQFTENLSIDASYYYLGSSNVFAKLKIEDLAGQIQSSEQNIELGTVTPMMVVMKLSFTF